MFRDDKQRGEVCALLCRWIPTSPWRPDPSGWHPLGCLRPKGIATSEQAMITLSFAIWRGEDFTVYVGFDPTRMRDVGELIVAMARADGPLAIDDWIEKRSGREAAKPIPFPGTLAHATTPGYGAPYPDAECVSCGGSGVDIMADGSTRPCHCRGSK